MKDELLDILVCLYCKKDLLLNDEKWENHEIYGGKLICTNCGEAFPIMNGIPILMSNGKL